MNNKEIFETLLKSHPESAYAFRRAMAAQARPWEWNRWGTLMSANGPVMSVTQEPIGPDFEFIAAARQDIPRMANELTEALAAVEYLRGELKRVTAEQLSRYEENHHASTHNR